MAENDELSKAIAGYRKARGAELGVAGRSSSAAAARILEGGTRDEARASAAGVRAGVAPVSVGGREGFTAQEKLEAQFRAADLKNGLAKLQSEHARDVSKSETQKQIERMKYGTQLITVASEAETRSRGQAADVTRAKIPALAGLASDAATGSAGKVAIDGLLAGPTDTQIAQDFMNTKFPDLLNQSDTGTAVSQEFWDAVSMEMQGMNPRERYRFAQALGSESKFPVERVLMGEPLHLVAREAGLPADDVLSSQTITGRIEGIQRGFEPVKVAIEQDLLATIESNKIAKAARDEIVAAGGGGHKHKDAIMAAGEALMHGDADAAMALLDAAPRNTALEGAADTALNLPSPEAPLTSSFDLKRKIMGSELFQERSAGKDPEEFFKQEMRDVGRRAKARVTPKAAPQEQAQAQPAAPESGPTRTGVKYDVDRLVQ